MEITTSSFLVEQKIKEAIEGFIKNPEDNMYVIEGTKSKFRITDNPQKDDLVIFVKTLNDKQYSFCFV